MRFDEIQPKISFESLEAVLSLKFSQMTPVQASTIPLFMSNKVI
jgi:ATP-dependent RNA helicase DDX55/SPB4